ncbi:dTDP-4-dehydrorhamnose reductase [Flavobacterium kingsejongi]|uniref:dTDP-4-dehydrorhamnose reductase n=1 Tax=Flavobacterium kingsejongi TaxID=1678728 RepID=A0A2S1LNX3_9FLAO|nr:dTDP-4-dehydrorhamnose reductase [Flavobacterium kingsejongi]AWG25362.1 dTDP-4-dehydrorhamnose reductase [Flavobacterium kingsejongi]
MKKILVTGSNGQLGSEIKKLTEYYSQFDFVFADRSDFSLDDGKAIVTFLNKVNPDFCINCGAYTAVDRAESEPELADCINHIAVSIIAKWTAENNCRLIHISTDYVFDGNSSLPLLEDAENIPVNVYGETKLLGEKASIENNTQSIIIRTSWVYSEFGNNFVKTILRLMSERDVINVVNDQIGSPTYAADLAEVVLKIIDTENWVPGIYHYSNEAEISWFDFAVAIKELTNSDCDVRGIATSEYPTLAKRPAYSLLNKNKIRNIYKIEIPNYKQSLIKCLNKLIDTSR